MATSERVTVTLPAELVRQIDGLAKNRSRFIAEAVVQELLRRQREALRRSLAEPHPESLDLVEVGLEAWGSGAASGDALLVDPAAGRSVRWIDGEGWVEGAS